MLRGNGVKSLLLASEMTYTEDLTPASQWVL